MTPDEPMEAPLASHTANFADTVEPCFQTLEPSALMGGRIAWPTSPAHTPPFTYCTFCVIDPELPVKLPSPPYTAVMGCEFTVRVDVVYVCLLYTSPSPRD